MSPVDVVREFWLPVQFDENARMGWECPIHGRQNVIACGEEGYLCCEDVSGRAPTSNEPYEQCGVPCGAIDSTEEPIFGEELTLP